MTAAEKLGSAFQQERQPSPATSNAISGSAFTAYRVLVHDYQSSWVQELRSRFDRLTALPIGWDGYGGRPVSWQCANFVANMLERLHQDNVPPPSLVPGADGSLQVEWHRNQFDVELDVLGVQNVVATRIDRLSGVEEVVEIQSDFSAIVPWINALSSGGRLLD